MPSIWVSATAAAVLVSCSAMPAKNALTPCPYFFNRSIKKHSNHDVSSHQIVGCLPADGFPVHGFDRGGRSQTQRHYQDPLNGCPGLNHPGTVPFRNRA